MNCWLTGVPGRADSRARGDRRVWHDPGGVRGRPGGHHQAQGWKFMSCSHCQELGQ